MAHTREHNDWFGDSEPGSPGRAADILSFMIEGIAAQYELLATVHARVASMMNVAVAAASRNEHLLVHTDSPKATSQQITELTRRALVAEMAATMRLSERMVASMLDDSEALTNDLPETLGALREGAITYQHAQQLVDQASALDDVGQKREFEQAALPVAKAATPPQFRHSARKLRERMHPETIEARRQRAEKDRHIEFVPGRDGMAWLSLYNTAAATLSIFNAACQTAQSLKTSGDERTKRQIAADVVVDALMAGMTAEPGQAIESAAGSAVPSGIRPTVLVTVPALTLLEREGTPAELEGYGPIDPVTARELAGRAPSFIRLLTHPETGAVLSVGRDRYAVPADLRRVIELRDEKCRFPGCNRRAIDCEIDHTHDWQFGGATEISNLACLCGPHHRLKHLTRWRVAQGEAGAMTWTSPLGKQYVTRPVTAQQSKPAELGFEAQSEADDVASVEIVDDDEGKNEPLF